MIDKVKFHIPINTPEQRMVRDEIAKSFSLEFEAVVMKFEELIKFADNGEPLLFPVSVVEVYLDEVTDDLLEFFKEVAEVIADKIGDSVVLEVTRESLYVGTAGIKKN